MELALAAKITPRAAPRRGVPQRWQFQWKGRCHSTASPERGPERIPISIFGGESLEEEAAPSALALESAAVVERGSHQLGQVVAVEEGVVMIEGLTSEAPVGTQLRFEHGQQGVLLWRYDSDTAFGLVLNGELPQVSHSVQCLMQPLSQGEDYQRFEIETGEHLRGEILKEGFLHTGFNEQRTPLLNKELDMASRQCIYEPLSMQHRGIDVLTPVGRGQCILLISTESQTLSDLASHLLAAQGPSVFTVYACVGKPREQLNQIQSHFQQTDSLRDSVVIQAAENDSLACRFASLCAALSIGESIREAGRDALVILDDLAPLAQIWNLMQHSYATRSSNMDGSEIEEELVEVNGTFMAAETAERRRFFSSVLQRAAKASEVLGGGSLTLVPVVHGMPASGNQHKELRAKLEAIEQDPKLSDTLKTKLKEKLTRPSADSNLTQTDSLPVFIVEEFMSIADGQIVVKESKEEGVLIDPLLSVSRIGARAYPPALESLAPTIRLQLAQAADAVQFGSTAETIAAESWNLKIEALREALVQKSGEMCPLSHQVILLMALQTKAAQKLSKSEIRDYLTDTLKLFTDRHPDLLNQIDLDQSLDQNLRGAIDQIVNHRG